MGATTELRDMLDAYGIEVTVHRPMTKAELARENAKLRELVRSYESLAAVLCNERDCAGCPFDSTAHVLCDHVRLAACMGELGIEVDDA